METLSASWIPDVVHWQAQVDTLETELAARPLFGEGNQPFPSYASYEKTGPRQSVKVC